MRIQIELDELGVETMNRIKAAAKHEDMSHKEFFNNAIAFLNWGVQQLLKGRQVGTLDEQNKNYAQMTMPLFERIQVAAAKPQPEKTEFTVVLTAAGQNKVNVIKAVREVTSLGLKEAKDLVDHPPGIIAQKISKEEAETISKKFIEAGATVAAAPGVHRSAEY